MTLKDQLDALLDATVFDSTGTKIGAVRQVYVDDDSGKITFATVSTGIFSSDAIVPLHGARLLDGELHVDHTRSVIRDSPRPDHTEDALTAAQEVKLLEYYGIEAPVLAQETAPSAPARPRSTAPERKATENKTPEGKTTESTAPERETPEDEAPVERPAERKSDTSPGQAEGSTPGRLDKKKTGNTTTTTSPKPEVGDTRTPAKPGTTPSGEAEPTERDAGEQKGEGGSVTPPGRG